MTYKELNSYLGKPLREVLRNLPLHATVVIIREADDEIDPANDYCSDEYVVKDVLNPDTEAYLDIADVEDCPVIDFGIYNFVDDSMPDRYDVYVKEAEEYERLDVDD